MKSKKLKHIKQLKKAFVTPKGYFDEFEDDLLAKISLDKLPKESAFKAPKGYFNSIEEEILKKLDKNKSKDKTGFEVPENYFQNLENDIIQKINLPKTGGKVINFKSVLLKRFIPIAAAASLLLFLYLNNNEKSRSMDTIASFEIEQWIENDLVSFDTYEIAELYKDVEVENQDMFAEEDLLEYLNSTDVESLIIEN
jgi:hypothetical protein